MFVRRFCSSGRLLKQYIPNMGLEYSVERQQELVGNVSLIEKHINEVCKEVGKETKGVTLVCVSKLKPASDIQALYDKGYRHFGENYVQELIEKVGVLPNDIKWHFIGGLQSNKCKDLAKISNLYVIETIDSIKKARKLNEARKSLGLDKIGICIQVNTSNEEQKSGCNPGNELIELIQFVLKECELIELKGLMTIGSYGVSVSDGENPEFKTLSDLKEKVEKEFELKNLMLSMGMSSDYAQAIRQGGNSVRVGSSIFGSRPANNGH